jgi:hypothetical protein
LGDDLYIGRVAGDAYKSSTVNSGTRFKVTVKEILSENARANKAPNYGTNVGEWPGIKAYF